jgi:hypothetical protein
MMDVAEGAPGSGEAAASRSVDEESENRLKASMGSSGRDEGMIRRAPPHVKRAGIQNPLR